MIVGNSFQCVAGRAEKAHKRKKVSSREDPEPMGGEIVSPFSKATIFANTHQHDISDNCTFVVQLLLGLYGTIVLKNLFS